MDTGLIGDWNGFEFHVRPSGVDVTMSQDKSKAILKEFKEFEAAAWDVLEAKACVHSWYHELEVKRCSTCPTVCPYGQGRDTAVVHRGRCFSFWYGSHSLLIRVGSSGVLGFGTREVGLGEILRAEGRPCVPTRLGVAGSCLSVLVFSDLVSAFRCQARLLWVQRPR